MEPTTPTSTPTERSILSVITYFDLFSYPLTDWEVWKWMTPENGQAPTYADVRLLLTSSAYLRERLRSLEGLYYLRGRSENVTTRKDRYLTAEQKYKKVLRAVNVFRCLPFIRTIAVCNSLAYSNTREDGDLDVFVITEPGKVWTVRLFTAGLAKLFGWRPKEAHSRDAVCLSFFLAADQLDLSSYLLQPDDRYMQFWLDQLVPVYGDASVLDALREQNAWWQRVMPHAYGVVPARRRTVRDVWWSRVVRSVLALFHIGAWGRLLEQRYRTMQLNVLPQTLALMANKDSRVVIGDHVLKFHENDRRGAIAVRFAEQFAKVV